MPDVYPIRLGVVTHPARWDGVPAVEARNYVVDEDKRYRLVLYYNALNENFGTCKVRSIGHAAWEAYDLDVEIAFDVANLYGAFSADEEGNATLDEVLLVVAEPS